MKYAGMPMGMWVLFGGSFRKHLSSVYGYDPETAKAIAAKAKPNYKEIIGRLPEFEKADRFKMNIVKHPVQSPLLFRLCRVRGGVFVHRRMGYTASCRRTCRRFSFWKL